MTMLNRIKPQNMNHLTMMAKTYEEDNGTETTEGETTDHSEDPLNSQSSSLSNWDAGVEIPIIESSLRKMRVSVANETTETSDGMEPPRRSCPKTEGRKRRRALQRTGEMKLRLPMCSTPLHKQTCISFNPSVMVRQFRPSVKVNSSRRHRESLWYQESDYSRMGKKCHRIAQKAMRGENQDGNHTLCTRGLESLICPSQRRDNKLEGWVSVLDEQENQQSQGYFDEEKMRLIYQTVSSESLTEAQRRGMADEEDVQRYLEAIRSVCQKLQR